MKPIIGYYYRLSSETLKQAVAHCLTAQGSDLPKTRARVESLITYDKENFIIGKNSKPKIFRVVLEEVK